MAFNVKAPNTIIGAITNIPITINNPGSSNMKLFFRFFYGAMIIKIIQISKCLQNKIILLIFVTLLIVSRIMQKNLNMASVNKKEKTDKKKHFGIGGNFLKSNGTRCKGANFYNSSQRQKDKKIIMEDEEKGLDKIQKIIKVRGFSIMFKGDPSVGIFDSRWELSGDFYFDDKEELEAFRKELQTLYENYCGEVTIETFEEYAERFN